MTVQMSEFRPFKKDLAQSVDIDGLTIEADEAHAVFHGTLDISKTNDGLASAYQLKRIVDAIVETLESSGFLPDTIAPAPTGNIDNPFK